MNNEVWVVTLCNDMVEYRRLGGPRCLQSTMKMEAPKFSET